MCFALWRFCIDNNILEMVNYVYGRMTNIGEIQLNIFVVKFPKIHLCVTISP